MLRSHHITIELARQRHLDMLGSGSRRRAEAAEQVEAFEAVAPAEAALDPIQQEVVTAACEQQDVPAGRPALRSAPTRVVARRGGEAVRTGRGPERVR